MRKVLKFSKKIDFIILRDATILQLLFFSHAAYHQ